MNLPKLARLATALLISCGLLLGIAPSASAAISVVASSNAGNGVASPATNLSLSNPGSQTGDVLIAQIVFGSSNNAVGAPAGWTSFSSTTRGSVTQRMYYRVASGSEAASYSFSFASSRASGGLIVVRGVAVSGVNPISAIRSGNGSGTTLTALAANAVSANSLVLRYFARSNGNNALNAPATRHYNPATGANNNGVAASASSALQVVAGQSGNATATAAGSNANWLSLTVVLAPAPDPPPPSGGLPLLGWDLDEASWTGAAGEVLDSSGNGFTGTVFNAPQTSLVAPALPTVDGAGTCRYGGFVSGSRQYVQHPHNSRLTLQGSFTIGLWIKPQALPASGLMTILSKDENYEFHLNPNGSINWWWQTDSNATRSFSSTGRVTAGQWTHVLIRFAPNDQRIYINGVLAGQATLAGVPKANTDPLQLGNDQNVAGRFFNGDMDQLRIYDVALSDAQITALYQQRHTCPLNLQCFNDTFARSDVGPDWAVTTSGGSFGLPVIVANRLRMTNSSNNVATAATLQRLFPGAGNYVQVQFQHYAYNGNGADGMGVILSDASVTPTPGSYGGPLGYGTRGSATTHGFAGGWLGVGIDEYGNFSTEGGPGGPGRRIDSVSARGSGSGTSGYRYIGGTAANLSPGIDLASSTTAAPGYLYQITVDNRVLGKAMLTVARDTGAGFMPLVGLDNIDILAATGQAAMPQDFYLSFTGSTGGARNIHELAGLQVCASEIKPLTQLIDHFEFVHAGNALTCNPLDVLIRACMDATCSSTYLGPVTATFSPSGWVGGDSVTFSGGSVNRQLRVTSPGSVTLSVSSSTPSVKPLSQTLCSSGGALSSNCAVSFADSGFIFDVPNTLSAKPTSATIQAVKKSDSSQACVPGFASGMRTLQFTSSYSNPATGTLPVQVNGTAVTASPTNVSLNFDATASAPLSVQYNDAGLMILNASYAGSGIEAGLVMTGSDQFVAKPYGLCLQTDTSASCAAADISCPVFPGNIRAGDSFALRIKAVGWQVDGEALTAAALCTGNPVTPNFQLSGIAMSSQLLGPVGGSSGSLGLSSYSHVLGNQTTVTQSISEVGVFTLTASPVANSYLGETVSASVSGYVGRMIPKYLGASGNASLTPACGTAFSYQGQPMGFAAGQEPRLTLTGYNAQGSVTNNYDRGAFWRMTTPTRGTYQSVTGLASLDAATRLQLNGTASALQSGADNGDGARSYTWSGETLSYSPAVLPSADDLPFTAAIRQPFTAAALTDIDGSCYLNGQPSCQAYSFDFLNSPGSQVRLGRLRIGNAHGSELQGLNLPLWLESWQNIGTLTAPVGTFRVEPADTCSGPLLGMPQLGQYRGNLQAGEVSASLLGPLAGSGSIQLSAPGAGNDGSVQASLTGLNWLWYDWNGSGREAAQGLAAFGVYQGSTPLIFRRELYR